MPSQSPQPQFTVLEPDSCDGCGLCCQGIGSPVLLYASRPGYPDPHPYRPADLPDSVVAEIDRQFAGLTRGQEPQDQCVWYDPVAMRCKHYQWRPQICRDYELGGPQCLIERSKYLVPPDRDCETTCD